MEKELSALGDPSKSHHDVFRHCRGFERAFQTMLNEANVAFKIRAVVEGNLPETLRRIPIEKRFNKNYTREICREADGVQPHLVSPEAGIKRLVAEAMKLTRDHVHRFVDEIHLVLMETVREAARRSVLGDLGFSMTPSNVKDLEVLRLKGFENAVIMAANQALEDWRSEAHRVAEMMVQMECDYVTPSFFRDLEKRWQEEAAMSIGGTQTHDRIEALAAGEVSADAEYISDDESTDTPTGSSSNRTPPMSPNVAANSPAPPAALMQRDDMKAGWLEKRSADTSSLSAVPVDSWRWQRRWFVVAVEAGYLYYFKTPGEVQTEQPKVAINLRECIIDDFQPEVAGMPTKKSTQRLDGNAGSVSLLIRIAHRNPGMPVAKNHPQIILRAVDASEKYDWLARLRHASVPSAGKGSGRHISGTSSQYLGGSGSGEINRAARPSSPSTERGLFGRTLTKVTDTFSKMSTIGSSKMGDVTAVGSIEDLDAYYEKLGTFCGLYARSVFDRMGKTVPKAIILCQVIRSRDRLLDQLFNYMSSLSEKETAFMLQEDPAASRRRVAAQQATKDLHDAIEEVKKLQESRAEMDTAKARAKERDSLSIRTLLLAGAFPLIPQNWIPSSIDPGAVYGEHTPIALLSGSDARKQLGPKAERRADKKEEEKRSSSDGGTRAPSGTALAKPRRQAPPPPPSLG